MGLKHHDPMESRPGLVSYESWLRDLEALEAMLKGERVKSDKKKKSARDAGWRKRRRKHKTQRCASCMGSGRKGGQSKKGDHFLYNFLLK